MAMTSLREFLRLEAAGGFVLLAASALALLVANSPLAGLYLAFLQVPVAIQIGALEIAKPMLLWINDGLMAVFFFLVGLEIKREFLEGELSSRAQITFPAVGAVGGMVAPALIFVAINQGNAENMNGWAIPTATDIAFALGVLALLGDRVPLSLKVLLTAIAIIDDLGAIVIIAIFYTDELSFVSLGFAALFIVVLAILSWRRVGHVGAYAVLGVLLWIAVLKSGVHATLAGIITAWAVPMSAKTEHGEPLLKHLEHALHPWIAFAVLPIFAFANAGVSFAGVSLASFVEPVKLGVTLGLFVGKQVGILGCLWLAVRLRLCAMPADLGWWHIYGVALLCGVGFTMSLFIASLAFEHSDFDAPIRLGVISGSLLAGLLGYLILRFVARPVDR